MNVHYKTMLSGTHCPAKIQ